MKCKKCGNEIKEGNNFCTECGKSINYSIKSKLKDYKVLIIITVIWLICMIIFMSLKTNGSKKDTTTIDKNTALEDTINSDKNESSNEDSSDIDVSDDEVDVNVEDKQEQDEQEKVELNNDTTSTNKQENSNNSNSDSDEEDYIEDNNQDNEEEYKDTSVSVSYYEVENKTEEELVKIFKEKGLVPKVNKETREVPYVHERANTTVITDTGYGSYEKGETVEIGATYYKPVAWKTYVKADTCKDGKGFNLKGKTCYTEKLYVNYDVDVVYCFYENPVGLKSYEINQIGRGVEFYINGELVGKGSSLSKEYTFDKVEKITFKVVAPYVYEFSIDDLDEGEGGTMIGTNVVLYEKKINVKDLYRGERENAEIEIK